MRKRGTARTVPQPWTASELQLILRSLRSDTFMKSHAPSTPAGCFPEITVREACMRDSEAHHLCTALAQQVLDEHGVVNEYNLRPFASVAAKLVEMFSFALKSRILLDKFDLFKFMSSVTEGSGGSGRASGSISSTAERPATNSKKQEGCSGEESSASVQGPCWSATELQQMLDCIRSDSFIRRYASPSMSTGGFPDLSVREASVSGSEANELCTALAKKIHHANDKGHEGVVRTPASVAAKLMEMRSHALRWNRRAIFNTFDFEAYFCWSSSGKDPDDNIAHRVMPMGQSGDATKKPHSSPDAAPADELISAQSVPAARKTSCVERKAKALDVTDTVGRKSYATGLGFDDHELATRPSTTERTAVDLNETKPGIEDLRERDAGLRQRGIHSSSSEGVQTSILPSPSETDAGFSTAGLTDTVNECSDAYAIPVREGRSLRFQTRIINPYLVCQLCKGYYNQASTIIECLHSFCQACILRHVRDSANCPECRCSLGPNPEDFIKTDRTLQAIVNKVFPHLDLSANGRSAATSANSTQTAKRKASSPSSSYDSETELSSEDSAFPEPQQKMARVSKMAPDAENRNGTATADANDSEPNDDGGGLAVAASHEISFSLRSRTGETRQLEKPFMRSSTRLSIAVLRKYLFKKVYMHDGTPALEAGSSSGSGGEPEIEIYCRDNKLSPDLSLDEINREYWQVPDDLVLTYQVVFSDKEPKV